MLFWIITGALALAVSAILIIALLRGRVGDQPPAAYDLQVYRDQLKEVDRDLARGVISEADAERVRTEVSRRVLAADAQLREGGETGGQSPAAGRAVAALTVAALVGGGLWLYSVMGQPGYPDLPLEERIAQAREIRDTRPSQAEAEADMPPSPPVGEPSREFLDLMEKLRVAVADRPDDLTGQELLARNEALLGNFAASNEALARILTIKGDGATPDDYMNYAEGLIMATGGYVSPEAEIALRATLARDPRNGGAQYYMGLMQIQTGRPDLGFRTWERLLEAGPADAPWIPPIRAQIEDVAARAGIVYTLPAAPVAPPLAGPSAEDMEAAGEMTAEERQEMIRGMVGRLSERLATEGGSPAEWSRLIGAYGVLGETGRARAIWGEAQQVFAGNPEALEQIRAGAVQAGVAE